MIKMIFVLGELGGRDEYSLVEALKQGKISKPVVAWVSGTCARLFKSEVQFGHAGAKSGGEMESAQAKNQALHDAGAVVPTSFEAFETVIKETFEKLLRGAMLLLQRKFKPPQIPEDLNTAIKSGKVRAPTHIISTISDDRAFDELLLMKRGGNVIYAGPLGRHSHKLVEYFEAVPGVPNITEGYNPATWMLDVSSTSVEAQLDVDFAEIYANSGLYQNQELIKELSTPAPGTNDLYFPTKYSQSLLTQCLACFWKQHWSYWRNSQHQQQDLLNLLGATYSAVLFLGASNANAVQIVVAVERTVFYRERAAGMYSELPYAFAQVAIETIYVVIQTFIYAFLLYSMIGFEWTAVKFFYFYYFIFMCFTYFSMYGMMVVALTPNHQIAAIVMSFFFSFWNLFSGFLIPRPGNRDHMVGWVKSRFRSLLVKVSDSARCVNHAEM
ncbi:unnamed protein product [Camellia sinensis]